MLIPLLQFFQINNIKSMYLQFAVYCYYKKNLPLDGNFGRSSLLEIRSRDIKLITLVRSNRDLFMSEMAFNLAIIQYDFNTH